MMKRNAIKLQETFGNQLRERRLSLGLTQEQTASRANINRSDLSDLERGKHSPTLATVEKMANALGLPPDRLLSQD